MSNQIELPQSVQAQVRKNYCGNCKHFEKLDKGEVNGKGECHAHPPHVQWISIITNRGQELQKQCGWPVSPFMGWCAEYEYTHTTEKD